MIPNIKDCYIQFGNLHETNYIKQHSKSSRQREKYQLFQINGAAEYVISYNTVSLPKCTLIGRVIPECGDVMEELEACATIDGRGT